MCVMLILMKASVVVRECVYEREIMCVCVCVCGDFDSCKCHNGGDSDGYSNTGSSYDQLNGIL